MGAHCRFCRVELPPAEPARPQEILDFLAEAVPGAESHRGAFDRGPIREIQLGADFRARLRKDELELSPASSLEDWLDGLLGDLRRRARADHELRSQLTRRGWSLQ